jgi:hypothetical protein
MRTQILSRIFMDQRGIAMPMAMMIILILSALMAAFSVLGASEPTLAANQHRVAQARAIAESGLQRAIWALNNPSDASGIPNPLVAAVAPYDGNTAVPIMLNGVQLGVFTVSVTNGAQPSERNIVATGWVPSNTGDGPKVKQVINVTVIKLRNFAGAAPAALSVRGDLDVGGHSLIDSRSDNSCGSKSGSWSRDNTSQGGSSTVYGYGNDAPNSMSLYSANPSDDIVKSVPDSIFDNFTYSSDELDMLKAIAKAQGTYYKTPAGDTVTFNAGNQIPNGLIFVDTVSGNNITADTPSSDFGQLRISGNAAQSVDPVTGLGLFKGWIIVNGSARIDGVLQMHGLLYVVNDLIYQGVGYGRIEGAVISQNVRDTSFTSIDSDTGGNSTIIYNCTYATTGDLNAKLPQSFLVKPGTYKEVAG